MLIQQYLRMALQGEGQTELISSIFFSLQSPTVEAYKAKQKSAVDAQKTLVSSMEGM